MTKPFLLWCLFLKERIWSHRSKFCPKRVDPIEIGGGGGRGGGCEKKMTFASPENVPVCFKSDFLVTIVVFLIQSTLFISKLKGPSETLRDIRTSTYQIFRIEENTNHTTKFHKWICNKTPLVKNIYWKYCGKWEKLLLRSNFSSYPNILLPDVRMLRLKKNQIFSSR